MPEQEVRKVGMSDLLLRDIQIAIEYAMPAKAGELKSFLNQLVIQSQQYRTAPETSEPVVPQAPIVPLKPVAK
jgi:hypothetical protein